MDRRLRHLAAVLILATALCADRAIAAAPSLRPAVGGIASSFVQKLARNLGRVTRPASFRQTTASSRQSLVMPIAVVPACPQGLHAIVSPFQFRLPPPAA